MKTGPRIIEVDEAGAGQRVDNCLTRILKDVPKSRIYKMIRRGEVRVNGGRVKPTTRLAAGDKLRIPPVRTRSPTEEAFIGSRRLEALETAYLSIRRREDGCIWRPANWSTMRFRCRPEG